MGSGSAGSDSSWSSMLTLKQSPVEVFSPGDLVVWLYCLCGREMLRTDPAPHARFSNSVGFTFSSPVCRVYIMGR